MARRKKEPDLNTRFEPQFWEDLKQTTRIAIRIKKRLKQLEKEVQADSLAKQMLVQRAVFLSLRIETMEMEVINDNAKFEYGAYVHLVNAFKGCLRDLGLEKHADTLNLQEYLKTEKRRRNRKAGKTA